MSYLRSDASRQRDQGAVLVDPLAIIYNEGNWKIYKVSPMYNLQNDTVKLKKYASKIRQAIVSTITASSSYKYSVVVDPKPYLKYSEDDPHGLYITVTSSMQEANCKTKLAYSALLLSWGKNTKLTGSTHLPYLLERGEQKIGAPVRNTLQNIFDCNISQICFTQRQLLQFAFKFLEYDTSRDSEGFVLLYRTPQEGLKDKLYFSFEIGDMRIMYNEAKEEAANSSELVNLAYVLIQNQILHNVILDVSAFELTEVNLPKGGVKINGTVKMKSAEIVNCVFTLLNYICS